MPPPRKCKPQLTIYHELTAFYPYFLRIFQHIKKSIFEKMALRLIKTLINFKRKSGPIWTGLIHNEQTAKPNCPSKTGRKDQKARTDLALINHEQIGPRQTPYNF